MTLVTWIFGMGGRRNKKLIKYKLYGHKYKLETSVPTLDIFL